jgi:hypothetical protein
MRVRLVFIFTILIQKTLVALANYVRKGSLRHQYREVMRLKVCRHGLKHSAYGCAAQCNRIPDIPLECGNSILQFRASDYPKTAPHSQVKPDRKLFGPML